VASACRFSEVCAGLSAKVGPVLGFSTANRGNFWLGMFFASFFIGILGIQQATVKGLWVCKFLKTLTKGLTHERIQ
jgi:hypothetical protein